MSFLSDTRAKRKTPVVRMPLDTLPGKIWLRVLRSVNLFIVSILFRYVMIYFRFRGRNKYRGNGCEINLIKINSQVDFPFYHKQYWKTIENFEKRPLLSSQKEKLLIDRHTERKFRVVFTVQNCVHIGT